MNDSAASEEHDVEYFRRMIKENTAKLTELSQQWEDIKLEDCNKLTNKVDGK